MSDRAVRDLAAEIVSRTAERLVREEIDRIKSGSVIGLGSLSEHPQLLLKVMKDVIGTPGDAISLPEKPALEGLETKWSAEWESDGTYRFDRSAERVERLRDRYAAAHGQRVAARRPRVFVHAHRHPRALSPDARPRGVLSDGMGRQRPADRTPRAELLRRSLRSVASVRRRLRCRRRSPASTRSRCLVPTSSSCASG